MLVWGPNNRGKVKGTFAEICHRRGWSQVILKSELFPVTGLLTCFQSWKAVTPEWGAGDRLGWFACYKGRKFSLMLSL